MTTNITRILKASLIFAVINKDHDFRQVIFVKRAPIMKDASFQTMMKKKGPDTGLALEPNTGMPAASFSNGSFSTVDIY